MSVVVIANLNVRRFIMAKPGLELLGDKELKKLFKTLGPRIAKRVLKKAMHAAAMPPLKSARSHVPVDEGLLKKSLGRVTKVNRRNGSAVSRVGASTSVEAEVDGVKKVPWRYSHLQELGHVTEDGTHVPAKPFLRPAADETAGQSLNIIKDKLAEGIAAEAKKNG
jgi:HK97 gp10 family phage protein